MAQTAHVKNGATIVFPGGRTPRASLKRGQNGANKASSHVPPDLKLSRVSETADVPAPEAQMDLAPASATLSYLVDPNDPGKILADVRDALFGPTRQLHEQRMEELVIILEETDRTFRDAVQKLQAQIANVEMVNAQQAIDMTATNQLIGHNAAKFSYEHVETNNRLDALSKNLLSALQQSDQNHQMLTENLSSLVAGKLEGLSVAVAKQMDEMSTKHDGAVETLSNEFATRMHELTVMMRSTDDKIMTQLDARIVQAEFNSEEAKRSNIQALTEGLGYLSERVMALQNG